MSICSKISAGLAFDCANPPIAGVDDLLIVINRDDWKNATITRDNNNPQLITDIVLASGVVAYTFEGKNNSIEPATELVKRPYSETYKHMIDFKAFVNTAAAKETIEKLAQGLYVGIVANNKKGASGAECYEVYGNDAGLQATVITRKLNDADTQGVYAITLSTPEKSAEGNLPASLFKTDYATTKAIVDGLI
jgi:GH15 family glucan-1,4-alpha-glucosidase